MGEIKEILTMLEIKHNALHMLGPYIALYTELNSLGIKTILLFRIGLSMQLI